MMEAVQDTRLDLEDSRPEGKNSTTLLSRSFSKVSNVTYHTKKTMAQGMMDIALLTANANQLRYIIEFRNAKSTNFVFLLVLIACSLILQVLVGIMLIFKGRLDSAGGSSTVSSTANEVICVDAVQLNNYVVLGVFLITVINIFIAAFTVAPT